MEIDSPQDPAAAHSDLVIQVGTSPVVENPASSVFVTIVLVIGVCAPAEM